MKRTSLFIFTALFLMLLAAIACISFGITDGILILALPFTLVGKGLRVLSLSSSVGNVVAIVLYTAICLLPLFLKFRQKWSKRDILLPLCSAVLFYVMYCMINPACRPTMIQNSTGDLVMAGTVYSILLSWLILGFLETLPTAGTDRIYSALRTFLGFCIAEFAVAIVASVSGCISSVHAIHAANTAPELNLWPTYLFTVVICAVAIMEYALDIYLLLLARKLLRQLEAEPYGELCCNSARQLSDWCKKQLILLTLSTATLNLLQLLFAGRLYNLSFQFHLPLFSLALAFALLALTHLLHQGKLLKEDNDLFI